MIGKKTMVIGVLALALVATGFAAYTNLVKPKPVGVSKLKNNPQDFVGNLLVSGRAGTVLPDRGLIEMVDEKACCSVVIAVPTTPEQQSRLNGASLFSGRLPDEGQNIEVEAKLVQTDKGFALEVKEVRLATGETLLKKI